VKGIISLGSAALGTDCLSLDTPTWSYGTWSTWSTRRVWY
jgi:hypothetical protein